jgi:gamma-glutamyltranspeptidase / glutathione hydrolase
MSVSNDAAAPEVRSRPHSPPPANMTLGVITPSGLDPDRPLAVARPGYRSRSWVNLAVRHILGGLLLLGLVLHPLVVLSHTDEERRVQTAVSEGGMVVSASPLATEAGKKILEQGGSAVDGAVTVAFAMAVTWPEAGNIGGGGFMMVQPADAASPVCIDYRECAPLSARADFFSRDDSTLSAKAVGVPGTVRGLSLAHQRYGRLPWHELLLPAVELAADGFPVDRHLAASLNGVLRRGEIREKERFAEFRRVYGKADGSAWEVGDRLRQPELAATLQRIAEQGADGFYRGIVAQRIVAEMKRSDGRITLRDLAEYEAIAREPIHGSYRGYDVWGPPPPSSGGIGLALMLHILEPYSLREHGRYSPQTLHLMAEAMRRSYSVRARYLGDPAFTPIPRRLSSPEFARQLASTIELHRATPSEQLAEGISLTEESESTTHFSVVDAEGMAVSNTYTLEASFGSCLVVRGAGFLLNNEMGDFNWFPGVTTRQGRIGTLPNIVAPRKRMLSSQTPVIVTRNGMPVLLTGSPGGRTIINTVLGIVLNVLEFDMNLADAVEAPRVHHGWFPDELVLEQGERPEVQQTLEGLQTRGHAVQLRRGHQGAAHSISIDRESGLRTGVADWRRGGTAAGTTGTRSESDAESTAR